MKQSLLLLILCSLIFFGCVQVPKPYINENLSLEGFQYFTIEEENENFIPNPALDDALVDHFRNMGIVYVTPSFFDYFSIPQLSELLIISYELQNDERNTYLSVTATNFIGDVIFSTIVYSINQHTSHFYEDIVNKSLNLIEPYYDTFSYLAADNNMKYVERTITLPEFTQEENAKTVQYFDENRLHLDPLEGIWRLLGAVHLEVTIRSANADERADFIGIVSESDNLNIRPGMILYSFEKSAQKEVYTVEAFDETYRKYTSEVRLITEGKIRFQSPDSEQIFIKTYPEFEELVSDSSTIE